MLIFATRCQILKKPDFIKKLLAILVLLVFTISATPKKYFHDLFSRHTDVSNERVSTSVETSEQTEIGHYKFNCGFVNIVATAPFLNTETFSVGYFRNWYPAVHETCDYFLPSQVFTCFTHRGPPCA